MTAARCFNTGIFPDVLENAVTGPGHARSQFGDDVQLGLAPVAQLVLPMENGFGAGAKSFED